MKPTLNRLPALPLAIGAVAGIVLWWLGCPWWAAACLILAAVALIYFQQRLPAVVLMATGAWWILAYTSAPTEAPAGLFDGNLRQLRAELISISSTRHSQSMLLRVDSIGDNPVTPFVVSATSLPDWMPPQTGARIRLTSILEPPELSGAFRYQKDRSLYYLRNSISAQTFVEDDSLTVVGRHAGFKATMADRRMIIVDILAHTGLNDAAYGLLAALLTGYGDDLDYEIRENFRATGIAHALALSGFHVGIIAMIAGFILFPLRAWPRLRPWRYLIMLIILWLYAAMVGMSDSIVRACIMFTAFIICRIIGRRPDSINALMVAVIVILAARPFSLFSAGFQLSVCAVLGILLFSDRINPVAKRNWIGYVAVQYVTVPLGATLGTLPATVYYFHAVPLVFILSNLLITLLLPLLMVAGTVIVLLSALGSECVWLCGFVNFMVNAVAEAASSLGSISWARTPVYISGWQCAALAAAILCTGLSLHIDKAKARGVALAVALACTAILPVSGDNIPENEFFIIPTHGNTPIIMRSGHKVAARFTCNPGRLENARMRLENELEHYLAAHSVDTMIITTGDTRIGPYDISGGVLSTGCKRIAILDRPIDQDSLAMKADYALICSRYRGSADDARHLTGADTLILSRDLSLKHRARIPDSVALIDLRYRFLK